MNWYRVVLLGFALGGCNSHTVVDHHRPAVASVLEANDAIVVLGRSNRLAQSGDSDFVECIGENLATSEDSFRVIHEEEFADAMYPWFESTLAPTEVGMLSDLFENDEVSARFNALAVKYLIWIEGQTETVDSRGSISCTVSPGGGGCFGLKTWDDEAEYTATVWNLDEQSDAGRIGTRTQGTSYVPAFILPVPLLARVKGTACDAMSSQITEHFSQ